VKHRHPKSSHRRLCSATRCTTTAMVICIAASSGADAQSIFKPKPVPAAAKRMGTSLLNDLPALRDELRKGSDLSKPLPESMLQGHFAAYRSRTQQIHYETAVYQGFMAVRDSALAAGGAAGIAAAGAFRLTLDRVVLGAQESKLQTQKTLLSGALHRMTAQQRDLVRSNPRSTEAQTLVANTVKALLTTSESPELSQPELDVTLAVLNRSMGEMTVDTWNNVLQMAQAQQEQGSVLYDAAKQLGRVERALGAYKGEFESLTASMALLVDDLKQRDWDKLSATERYAVLQSGGRPDLDPKERKTLEAQLKVASRIEKSEDVLQRTAGALGGLAVIATVIKDQNAARIVREAQKTVQYGQQAISIFKGFVGGGPLGGLTALGGMSGMLGGGGDGAAMGGQLKVISAKLDEISDKLDQVLELQFEMLQVVHDVSTQVARVEGKVDELQEELRQLASDLARAVLLDTYAGCAQTFQTAFVQTPEGVQSAFPLRSPTHFVAAHFPNFQNVRPLESANAKGCFDQLSKLLTQPRSIVTASPDNPLAQSDGSPTVQPQLWNGLRDRELAFRGSAQELEAFIPAAWRSVSRHESIHPVWDVSVRAMRSSRHTKQQRPSAVEISNPKSCLWHYDNCPKAVDDIHIVRTAPAGMHLAEMRSPSASDSRLLSDSSTRIILEYALGVYPQPIAAYRDPHRRERVLKGELPPDEELSRSYSLSSLSLARTKQGADALRPSQELLENAIRVADIAIANHVLAEGHASIDHIVDRVLSEPKVPRAAEGTCRIGDNLGDGFVGADLEALFWKQPDLADRVLSASLHRLLVFGGRQLKDLSDFPNQPDLDLSEAQYLWRLLAPPLDWGKQQQSYPTRQTEARAQRYWFAGQAPDSDGPLVNHIRVFYVPPGVKRSVPLRPMRLVQGGIPPLTPAASPSDRCLVTDLPGLGGTWHYERRSTGPEAPALELPEGWSMMLGPRLMHLPRNPKVITALRDPPSSALAALLDRRALLLEELASFSIATPSALDAIEGYGLRRQVQSLVKFD
jgi:hypothetical protein